MSDPSCLGDRDLYLGSYYPEPIIVLVQIGTFACSIGDIDFYPVTNPVCFVADSFHALYFRLGPLSCLVY